MAWHFDHVVTEEEASQMPGLIFCEFWPRDIKDAPGAFPSLRILQPPRPNSKNLVAQVARREQARARAGVTCDRWFATARWLGVEPFLDKSGWFHYRYADVERRRSSQRRPWGEGGFNPEAESE